VEDDVLTRADLLEQWRDAARAAQLAERLAKGAAESVERADEAAAGAEEIARIAEGVAKAAEEASQAARAAADRAAALAREAREVILPDADRSLVDTKSEEASARVRYHDAKREARERQTTS
jgi:methyl-accepting chemotaxis protein